MGGFSILKNIDPVGKQLFQPKDQGGAGLADPLGLYGSFLPPAAEGATPDLAPPPSLITPTPMATDTDKKQAQRRALTQQLSRKGRQSTILTDDSLGASR